jgi:hydroxymethylpyrimidine kinase/phosphomethylpyrimidine kinase
LGCLDTVRAVTSVAGRFEFPLVIDPVMISKHGAPLMNTDAREAFVRDLLPLAFLLTPNLHEAQALTGIEVSNLSDMKRAAEQLRIAGVQNVLVKGGHLKGAATDLLLAGEEFHEFPSERIDTPHTHGTGCTYSAAIVAGLAKGDALVEAVRKAKDFITRAIRTNPALGRGAGPVNHHA